MTGTSRRSAIRAGAGPSRRSRAAPPRSDRGADRGGAGAPGLRARLSIRPADITERTDPAEKLEPSEPAEPTEKAEPAEPTEPIEANDPTEPIEKAEPFEAIEQKESSDQSERLDSPTATAPARRRRWR